MFYSTFGSLSKKKYERMPLEKVLCSAEKSSVIWAEPHSRSSAEPNVRSVTTLQNIFKRASNQSIKNESKKILKIVFDWKLQFGFWVNPASQNCLLHHMNLWVFKRGPIHIYQKGIFLGNGSSKVHIFWEGHKILWNLHLTFVLCSASVRCCKILWPSQNIWTLIVVAKHSSP